MSKIDTSQRIFPDTKVVSPPDVLILFPPAMKHADLNHFANQFGSVQSLTLKTTGKALIKYAFPESAQLQWVHDKKWVCMEKSKSPRGIKAKTKGSTIKLKTSECWQRSNQGNKRALHMSPSINKLSKLLK